VAAIKLKAKPALDYDNRQAAMSFLANRPVDVRIWQQSGDGAMSDLSEEFRC